MSEVVDYIKEHPVMFDPNVWQDLEDNVVKPVTRAVESRTPPKASPGWHCRWCDFAHSCPKKGGGRDDPAANW